MVSSDCHAGAPMDVYRDYLESRWHDEFDEWAKTYVNPWSDLQAETASRNWDSALRLAELEADGVVAEVLFPNTIPPFFPSGLLSAHLPSERREYERRFAGIRAHNRWLADFCAEAPGRRAGIAQIFLNDVDDAVAEIRWAAEAGLTGGILLPGIPPDSGLPPSTRPTTSRCGRRATRPGCPSTITPARPRPSSATTRRHRPSSSSSSPGSLTGCCGT